MRGLGAGGLGVGGLGVGEPGLGGFRVGGLGAGRARRAVAGVALVGALLTVSGCASAVDPIERLGRKAAERGRESRETATARERAAEASREVVRPEDRDGVSERDREPGGRDRAPADALGP